MNLERVFRGLRTRIRVFMNGMYHPKYYPIDIKEVYCRIAPKKVPHEIVPITWYFTNPFISDQQQVKTEFTLAGSTLNIIELETLLESIELQHELDTEVGQAIHRFHWAVESLLSSPSKNQIQLLYDLVNKWMTQNSFEPSNLAWMPYTVSERICNWITLWQLFHKVFKMDEASKQNWINEILVHLYYLADHLEYPASGIINNHILNNARALYIGGQFLNRDDISNLGKAIFYKHLPEMVSNDGYLLEASSHYQLLLTRSLFEVGKIAETIKDFDLINWLDTRLKSMLIASNRIIPPDLKDMNDFPRIGDVSPDTSIEWFDPRVDKPKKSWSLYWGKIGFMDYSEDIEVDGWLTIRQSNWFILTYTHPENNNSYPIGHGHPDFGSFTLHYNGNPIFIDIGRVTYDKIYQGITGQEASLHNLVLFDGKEILSDFKGNKAKHSVIYGKENEKQWVKWSSSCGKNTFWERIVTIEDVEDKITIRESIITKKSVLVEGFLNMPPASRQMSNKNNRFEIDVNSLKFEISLQNVETAEVEKIPYFPHYGVNMETNRLRWSKQTRSSQSEIVNIVTVLN